MVMCCRMRLGFLRDHFELVLAISVVGFCFADEESVLDLSDFNLIHVVLLAMCILVVYFDLTLRARYGQHVAKDTTTMGAAFSFVWGLEFYVRILLLVFCVHNLMPLEIDLVELVELYQAWGAWVVVELLPTSVLLVGLFGSCFYLNLVHSRCRMALLRGLLVGVTLVHLLAVVCLAWDLVAAGFTAVSAWEEAEVFYVQPKTALTFDRALGVSDQFEWHKERCWPYALRFEDLYFFFFQLLLVWDLLCSLVLWGCITGTALRGGGVPVSYTQLALGLTWLEHVGVSVGIACLGLGGVGLRVWLHVAAEWGCFWV